MKLVFAITVAMLAIAAIASATDVASGSAIGVNARLKRSPAALHKMADAAVSQARDMLRQHVATYAKPVTQDDIADDPCFRGFIKVYQKWQDDECFKLFAGSGDDDEDDNGGISVIPDLLDDPEDGGAVSVSDSSSSFNSTQIEQFCKCKSTLVKVVGDVGKALKRCASSGDGSGFSFGDVDTNIFDTEFLSKAFDFMCIKNSGKYCIQIFDELDADFDGDDNEDVDGDGCLALAYCGCCCVTALEFANDISQISQYSELSTSDLDEYEANYDACQIDKPQPCVAPGESSPALTATFRLAINSTLSELGINTDGPARRTFVLAFIKDIAAALNVDRASIQVTKITQGSIIVDVTILTDSSSAASDLSDTVRSATYDFDNVRGISADYTDVSLSSKTASATTLKNNEGTSSASILTSSIAALVLVGLTALFA